MIHLAVFDMAGTVVDEQNLVYKAVHKAILEVGFDLDLETVLLLGAGKEKLQAIRDVLTGIAGNPVEDDLALSIFQNFQTKLDAAYAIGGIAEQPGAGEIFQFLQQRGIRVALNTGYSRQVTNLLLDRLGWKNSPFIDTVVCADDVSRGRPYPDMILLAMKNTGISDASTVFKIGDSQIDIEEGKNAGCGMTFGITTGAQTREQLLLAEPTAVLDTLDELKNYLP